MSISSYTVNGSASSPNMSGNYQVSQLEKKIQDWRTCPTTEAQTKQKIVQKLQIELDSVKSRIEKHAKENPPPQENVMRATGLGSRVDISA